eukprot:CAMPEP_0167769438 /NCGR_PEP_ID=MMETSP0110_2-20121227/17303_1 /TAXON_ID=629695 /ORGANISM="Gymnochlora sp., Strain CCMP2014" /LENGTH=306 /DNA_ID=CAMNT_0007658383 /DNA_START=165 /DNA_END=1083 /DNA_ORIENTATION=+
MKCFHHHYMGDFKLRGKDLRAKGLNRIGNLIVPNKNYCAFEDWLKPLLSDLLKEQQRVVKQKILIKRTVSKLNFETTSAGPTIVDDIEDIPSGTVILGVGDKIVAHLDSKGLQDLLAQEIKTKQDVKITISLPGEVWTPSRIIHRMGKKINNKDSCLYWAYKNNIPIFCPAITDGAVGDVVFFNSYREDGLIIDTAADIKRINKTGMLILGGGVVKHHICNANLMRNGADFSVFINTGQEFDGSDSGARPDEAISWGKIKIEAKPVKVYGDASLIFPLLVSQTFAKEVEAQKAKEAQNKTELKDKA